MTYGEPWKNGLMRIKDANGFTVAIDGNDSARIVACVNACAGLDLPDDVPAGALAELVAAAREALDVCTEYVSALGACDHAVNICNCTQQSITESLRAALAKLGRGF